MRRLKSGWMVAGVAACTLLGGCEKNEPVPEQKTAPAVAPAQRDNAQGLKDFLQKDAPAGAAAGGSLPAGHPPIGQTDAKPAMAAAPDSTKAIKYEVGKDWKTQPVTRPMRVAQYSIPGGGGDAEMAVFHGPGVGGGTDMNIDRWRSMFTRDGKPVGDDIAKIQKREVSGLKVTTLDVHGDYSDPMRLQGASLPYKGDTRMLAAIVETPDGPWFFKMVGPKATIDSQAGAFEAMVQSIKK